MSGARPGGILTLLVGLLVVLGCAGGRSVTPSPTIEPFDIVGHVDVSIPDDWDGATIELGALPQQARETLRLVEGGGPYPFRQDDEVFGNREGLLPHRPYGTYREYTVPTPGSPDRGARRLVIGDGREVYYTDDHYESFRFVVPDDP